MKSTNFEFIRSSLKPLADFGALLMQLMIEHGVGVSTHRVVKVVRVDSDCFEEV